jgi:hypothetical protein
VGEFPVEPHEAKRLPQLRRLAAHLEKITTVVGAPDVIEDFRVQTFNLGRIHYPRVSAKVALLSRDDLSILLTKYARGRILDRGPRLPDR